MYHRGEDILTKVKDFLGFGWKLELNKHDSYHIVRKWDMDLKGKLIIEITYQGMDSVCVRIRYKGVEIYSDYMTLDEFDLHTEDKIYSKCWELYNWLQKPILPKC